MGAMKAQEGECLSVEDSAGPKHQLGFVRPKLPTTERSEQTAGDETDDAREQQD